MLIAWLDWIEIPLHRNAIVQRAARSLSVTLQIATTIRDLRIVTSDSICSMKQHGFCWQ